MARIPLSTLADGAGDSMSKATPSSCKSYPEKDLASGEVATLAEEQGSWPHEQKLGTDTAHAENKIRDLETRNIKNLKSTMPTDVAKAKGVAQPPSRPQPPPIPSEGVDGGRGQKECGSASAGSNRAEAGSETEENAWKLVETTRGPKRQRSSDQVSPGSAAPDKKVCLLTARTAPQTTRPGGTDGNAHRAGGEPEARTSYAAAVKLYRVVVQDRGGVLMDELRATLLRKTLDRAQYQLFKENRMKPKEDRRLPLFWQLPRLTRGCLRMTPRDDFTLAWLASTVEQLPRLWDGSGGLRVISESELPRYHTGVIYVPDFGEDREDLQRWPYILREFLAELNRDVNVEEWPIFKHIVREVGDTYNHVLVMGIRPEDVENLKRVNCRLHYTTGSVYVKLKYNKTGGTVETKAGAGGSAIAALSSVSTPAQADAGDDTVPPEDRDWTKEEVERLLEEGDGGEDIAGGIMGLSIFSPMSLMDTERDRASSVNSLDA